MNYYEARIYLDEVSKYGSILGLENIRNLLDELGNPQEHLRFIHIAGTNGKGSVLAYISTILCEAGYKTGRYISPTVVSYLERIQVHQKPISEDTFAKLVDQVKTAITVMETKGLAKPTVFEVETAIAFLYFREQNCDLVVLETGLGGLLDATNIIKHTLIAVFTPISRDHMGFLGETLTEIARNKAGIIKEGCTVVTAEQVPEVRKVIEITAEEKRCNVCAADMNQVQITEANYEGQVFRINQNGSSVPIRIPLVGGHQVENAVTALEVVKVLNRNGYQIFDQAILSGFAHTVWPGRFTCILKEPLFIVDGAHNEQAVTRLKQTVETFFAGKRLLYIMGVFRDKEYEKMVDLMVPMAEEVFTVSLPDEERTLSAEELKEAVAGYEVPVYAMSSVEQAVEQALQAAEKEDVILAFGSLSYLGAVMQVVEEKKKGVSSEKYKCNE